MFQVDRHGLPLHVREAHANGFRVSRLLAPSSGQLPPDVITFRGATNVPAGFYIPKNYTRKERLGYAFQAIRNAIKQSWWMKIDLACGPLCLLSILMPHLLPLGTVGISLFTLGLCQCFSEAREAYQSPDIFLDKLKKIKNWDWYSYTYPKPMKEPNKKE